MSRELISTELKNIQRLAGICHEAAVALIETKNPWIRIGWRSRLRPTDYQRARRSVLANFYETQRRVAMMRKSSVNPAAIRSAADLNRLQECCLRCIEENGQALLPGTQFNCMLQEMLTDEQE